MKKMSQINIFAVKNVRRRTLFFGIAISIPGTTLQNVENRFRKPLHFVIHSELSVHGHQLPIGARHHKIQRENRLDPRKTGIRHRFA